jgi:EAL domain-containing protein (putative c-di-GMP-specific phosphodiesterase class I)
MDGRKRFLNMQKATPYSLNAAAWFFIGQDEEGNSSANVPIHSPFRVGRSPDSDLVLRSQSVSGNHARILEEEGGLWLYDLGSTNGTFVNGERIRDKVLLQDGDAVQFAAVVFHVTSGPHAGDSIRTADEIAEGSGETLKTLQLERLLNGGVVPFFQPIVDISGETQGVIGLEVLGRSRIFGLRTPKQMFAAASRVEMEAELSRVLRRQGIQLAHRQLPQDLSIFVNTHPAELNCTGLIESLQSIRDTCPGRPLTLEICESVLRDIERIIELRKALQDLDIRLAFDNFGAGQSRLFALSEVTPDFIKFDHKLIKDIDRAPARRQRFVAALVRMILELGVTPVAECVEGQQEHETLRQLGFCLAQGFYYGKPASLPDCLEWLNENRVAAVTPPASSERPLIESFLEPRTPPQPVNRPWHDEQWLLQQPPSQYTIQVLSAISLERAEEHVAEQSNPEDYAIFCKPGKTRMLYIVVYGVFEDREAAKQAAAGLNTVALSPWIRMLSGVQNEIRAQTAS